MNAKVNIITRQLPKTGQSQEYQSGDDGTYEAGWWRGLSVADNKERFIQQTISGDIIVIDRATGLVWAADGVLAGCNNGNMIQWSQAITYANELDFAGFDYWRLPNVFELMSILDYGVSGVSIKQPPFLNTFANYYWCGTTFKANDSVAWCVKFDYGEVTAQLKTAGFTLLRCVRGGL